MPGFDPFAFVGDVAKGVGDVANNAAKIAAGAVDGAIKAMASESNEGEQKSFEDHHDEPRPIPEPQYRDCEIDAFYVEKRYVAVRQITVGANGEPLEGYRHYLRLSRHGVERVQTADLFAKPMERIRVRNCTLFKNGEAALRLVALRAAGVAVVALHVVRAVVVILVHGHVSPPPGSTGRRRRRSGRARGSPRALAPPARRLSS